MGVVLAVNVKVVEGRNMSNVCAPNQTQKQCFMMFYCVLLLNSYLCCAESSTCPFYCGIQVTPEKGTFAFYAFIMNNNILLYLYHPDITILVDWA